MLAHTPRLDSVGSIGRIALAGAPVVLALLGGAPAAALPASAYQVEQVSYSSGHLGNASTNVRGVDSTGRALGYWSVYSGPPQVWAEPDADGYFVWADGVATDLSIPGLTNYDIHHMNAGGAMWGSSDQGAFVYRNDQLSLIASPLADVTIVQGVDAAGRVFGTLGNYPPGVDPNGTLVPIDPVSTFLWANGNFSEIELLLPDATLHGVLQSGVLFGSNAEVAFIQDGASLTVLDHPDFDYTGIHALTDAGEVYGFGLDFEGETWDSAEFFWDPVNGFQEWPDGVPLPGTSERPNELNEVGVFWGYAAPNTAFIATPIPEPGTAALLGLGMVALGATRRRRSAK